MAFGEFMNTAPATSLSTILPYSVDQKTAITTKDESMVISSSFKDDLKQVKAKKDQADKLLSVSGKSDQTAITKKDKSMVISSSFKDDLKQVEAKKDQIDKRASVSDKSDQTAITMKDESMVISSSLKDDLKQVEAKKDQADKRASVSDKSDQIAITTKDESMVISSSFEDDLKHVEAKKDQADKRASVSDKSDQTSNDASPVKNEKSLDISTAKKVVVKDADEKSVIDSNVSTVESTHSEVLTSQSLEDGSIVNGSGLSQIHDATHRITNGSVNEDTDGIVNELNPSTNLEGQDISSFSVGEEGIDGLNYQIQQLLATGASDGKETMAEALSTTLFSPLSSNITVDPMAVNGQLQNGIVVNNLSLSTELPLALSESFVKNHQQRLGLTDQPLNVIQSILSSSLDGSDSSQGVNPLSAQMRLASDTTPTSPLAANPNFYSPKWQESVTDKVMWMSAKGLKEATIQLDPPELGHMTIKVAVVQEQAQVSFTVQHASVREALDSHSIRLREMFAEEGIVLADVDVSDQSSQQDNMPESDQQANTDQNSELAVSSEADSVSVSSISRSLIDSYV